MKVLPKRSQLGFSSIAAMIVTFAVAAFATVWIQRDTNQIKLAASNVIYLENRAIRNTIGDAVHCGQTTVSLVPATSCNGVTAVPLKRANGSLVAPSNRMGAYEIVSTCKEAVDGGGVGLGTYYLNITARRLTTAGAVAKDPLTGKALDYASPAMKMFSQSEGLCSSALGSPSNLVVKVTAPLTRTAGVPAQAPNGGGGGTNHVSSDPSGSGPCVLGSTRTNAALPTSTNFKKNITTNGGAGTGGNASRAVFGAKFVGTATCPSGYKPISGGADCRSLGGYSFLQNGIMAASLPTANGWTTACCGNDGGVVVGASHPTVEAFVVCLWASGPP